MQCWYAVHSHANAEQKAAFHLRNQDFEVYLPSYRKQRRHARRIDWVTAPLFPRYLFVRMDIELERWRRIHSTVGVGYLICHGDLPADVPDRLIDEIRARERADGLVDLNRLKPFKSGEAVRFVSGPLSDHVGIFECETDDERVIILLDLLGRQIRVRAELDTLSALA